MTNRLTSFSILLFLIFYSFCVHLQRRLTPCLPASVYIPIRAPSAVIRGSTDVPRSSPGSGGCAPSENFHIRTDYPPMPLHRADRSSRFSRRCGRGPTGCRIPWRSGEAAFRLFSLRRGQSQSDCRQAGRWEYLFLLLQPCRLPCFQGGRTPSGTCPG